MLAKVNTPNVLESFLKKMKTVRFEKLSEDCKNEFPKSNLMDVKNKVTLGSYQISQSYGFRFIWSYL